MIETTDKITCVFCQAPVEEMTLTKTVLEFTGKENWILRCNKCAGVMTLSPLGKEVYNKTRSDF